MDRQMLQLLLLSFSLAEKSVHIEVSVLSWLYLLLIDQIFKPKEFSLDSKNWNF